MRVWLKLGLVTVCLGVGSGGEKAVSCELTGEFYQLGMQNTWVPWSKEFSTTEECQAAIGEADQHYYRNLHCEGCESANMGNENTQAGASNAEPAQEPSANEQAQQAAAEKERQANLAKEQKFKEDKQDALSQLKGVAGDSEESAEEKGNEPVSKELKVPRERSRSGSGGGWDRSAGGAKPKDVNIPPASAPVPDTSLTTLKKEVKKYKTELEKNKKKIQELNTQITQVAVQQNEAAAREAESAPATPPPGEPETKPTPAPKADDSAAKKLAELNALRQAALADQADLEKKISESEKQVDELTKPTPVP
jgi:DNA repair exonuclease SbcCD ATPase subunit